MATRILAGGVPEPDELFGREHTINYIWEQLAGNNVLLVAPRRFGKTGVMAHLLERPRTGYLPVYLEVEELHDAKQFSAALIAALLENSTLRSMISKVKGVPQRFLDFINERIKNIKTDVLEIELRNAVGDSWDSITRALILEMEKAGETVGLHYR